MADKKCALYIRVSTEKQAAVEEGSLRNQEDRLDQYLEMKSTGVEKWIAIDKYIERGRSGKNTDRPEFQRMMSDIRDGKIDVVLSAELSRISRSVSDLLTTVDLFKNYGVDFICLRENFDTTTPHGKMLFVVMAALGQFEREQTSERTRVNMLMRAKRGLWNGGYVLGYDLDPNRKGHLILNEQEAQRVNCLFDLYLNEGSVVRVAKIAREKGIAGKSWVSRRGRVRSAKKLCYSALLNILGNVTYVGQRVINKRNKNLDQSKLPEDKRYMIVDACWGPIVDREKFDRVQVLLRDNCEHKNNGAAPTKHSYLFNGGLLVCEKCNSRMEGRNGHGRGNKRYFHYYCINKECRHSVPEKELELAFQVIVKNMALTPSILNKTVEQLNTKLLDQLPYLKERRRVLTDNLNDLKGKASHIMNQYLSVENGKKFVEDELTTLTNQQDKISREIEVVTQEIVIIERQAIDEDAVKQLLGNLNEVFAVGTKPYQKKMILACVLSYLKISNDEFKLGIDATKFRSDITRLLRYDVSPHAVLGSQNWP